jgi:hypothetical protein
MTGRWQVTVREVDNRTALRDENRLAERNPQGRTVVIRMP